MANETFLVQLKQHVGSLGIRQVRNQIKEWKGEILIEIRGGISMIINIDSQFRELLEGLPQVSLAGGVQIRPPEIKRIQVPHSK